MPDRATLIRALERAPILRDAYAKLHGCSVLIVTPTTPAPQTCALEAP